MELKGVIFDMDGVIVNSEALHVKFECDILKSLGIDFPPGTGWYTQSDATILLVMCRNYESMHIFRIIKAIDEDAFVSQAKIKGVYGEGFDHVKVNIKKEEAEEIVHDAMP